MEYKYKFGFIWPTGCGEKDVKSLDSDVNCKMNSLVKNKPNLYHKGIEINMHTTPQYILNY